MPINIGGEDKTDGETTKPTIIGVRVSHLNVGALNGSYFLPCNLTSSGVIER